MTISFASSAKARYCGGWARRHVSPGLGPYSARFLRRVSWLYAVSIVAVCVSAGVGKLGTLTLASFVFVAPCPQVERARRGVRRDVRRRADCKLGVARQGKP
jgi:hypothetical protein